MANHIVRILKDDDGEVTVNPKLWHLVDPVNTFDTQRTLCTGECFGVGEGSAEYEEKQGKVDCPRCIEAVKAYKSIRL